MVSADIQILSKAVIKNDGKHDAYRHSKKVCYLLESTLYESDNSTYKQDY